MDRLLTSRLRSNSQIFGMLSKPKFPSKRFAFKMNKKLSHMKAYRFMEVLQLSSRNLYFSVV